jgi:hypothetical protein
MCCHSHDILGNNICLIVNSYHSQAMERGIYMWFTFDKMGPVDTAQPGNNLYRGMAIVFRRSSQPAIQESAVISASNEEEQIPTVAAEAFAVDHRDQDVGLTVASQFPSQ